MAKLPHICMISDHGCIRVLKEALALMERGYKVDLVARKMTFAFNRFNTSSTYFDPEHLKQYVRSSKADIFHVHNEPNWMVGAARDATGRAIIYDVHDMSSLRFGVDLDAYEAEAFKAADGYVFVTEKTRQIARERHNLHKPSSVLAQYMPEEFIPKDDELGDVSWTSLVYEGGVTTQSHMIGNEDENLIIPHYRYLLDVVRAFVKENFNVYIYAGFAQEDLTYESNGAVMAYNLPYPTMLRALRAFGYGFVGAPASNELLENTSPNKLHEYISQGVVPLVLNAEESARFVEENDLGIRLDGLENLREQLEPGPAIRETLINRRHEFTMEKHIGAICDLYEEVL